MDDSYDIVRGKCISENVEDTCWELLEDKH